MRRSTIRTLRRIYVCHGYRITPLFVDRFLSRVFETPGAVFTEEMLRPELQDRDQFIAGVNAIVDSQRRVALNYFEDGSVEAACPPVKALLHIMAHGSFEGRTAGDRCIRALFTRDALMASAWYRERLETKQARDIALWRRHVSALEQAAGVTEIDIEGRLQFARRKLAAISAPAYLEELVGTIGADPFKGHAFNERSDATPT